MKWIDRLLRRHEHEWVRAEDTRNDPSRYMYIPVVCKGCGKTETTWKDSWADPRVSAVNQRL